MPTIRPSQSQLSRPMPSRRYILEYGRLGKQTVRRDEGKDEGREGAKEEGGTGRDEMSWEGQRSVPVVHV